MQDLSSMIRERSRLQKTSNVMIWRFLGTKERFDYREQQT